MLEASYAAKAYYVDGFEAVDDASIDLMFGCMTLMLRQEAVDVQIKILHRAADACCLGVI